jgi:hypothetical protein
MPKLRESALSNFHGQLIAQQQYSQESSSLQNYCLQHTSYHLASVPDGEKLWWLMQNEQYRSSQYERIQQPFDVYQAFRYGLANHIIDSDEQAVTASRLTWLVLRAGEYAKQMQSGIEASFNLFREDVGQLDLVIQQLNVLDERSYCKASLLLLWIEVDRQLNQEEEQRDVLIPERILQAVAERIPAGTDSLDWMLGLSQNFAIWLISRLRNTWKTLSLDDLLQRTNSNHLSVLVSRLCTAHSDANHKDVFSLCQELLPNISKDSCAVDALLAISKILPEENRIEWVDKAMSRIDGITSRIHKSSRSLSCAKAYLELGESDLAFDLMPNLSSLESNKLIIHQVDLTLQQGRIVDALCIISEMSDDLTRSKLWISTLQWLLKNNEMDHCVKLSEQVTADKDKGMVFGQLAIALHHAKDERAESIRNNLYELAMSQKVEFQKVRFLTEYAKCLAMSEAKEEALLLLKECHDNCEQLLSPRMKLDSVANLIDSYAHLRLVDQALACAQLVPELYRDKVVSVAVESALINNRLNDAFHLAKLIVHPKYKGQIVSLAVSQYKQGDLLLALETLGWLETGGPKRSANASKMLGTKLMAGQLPVLIEECSDIKGLRIIQEFVQRRLPKEDSAFLFSELAHSYLQFEVTIEAQSVFALSIASAQSDDYNPHRIEGLLRLSEELNSLGKEELASQPLALATKLISEIVLADKRAIQERELIVTLLSMNQVDKALSIANQTLAKRKPFTLGAIAEFLLGKGDIEQAFEVIQSIEEDRKRYSLLSVATPYLFDEPSRIVALCETVSDRTTKSKMQRLLIEHLHHNENKEKAVSLAKGIEDDFTKDGVLAELALSYVNEQEYATALELALLMGQIAGGKVLIQIVQHMIASTQTELLEQVEPHLSKDKIPLMLAYQAEVCVKQQDMQKAEGLLEEAITLTDGLVNRLGPAHHLQAAARIAIGTVYFSFRSERADSLFDQAVEQLRNVRRGGMKDPILQQLVLFLLRNDEKPKALKVISEAGSPSFILGNLVVISIENGDLDAAFDFACSMNENNPKGSKDRVNALMRILSCHIKCQEKSEIKPLIPLFKDAILQMSNKRFLPTAITTFAEMIASIGFCVEAIELTEHLSSFSQQSALLLTICKHTKQNPEFELLVYQYLRSRGFSETFYHGFLNSYQNIIQSKEVLFASLLFCPFEPQLAESSALHLLRYHLRSGNEDAIQKTQQLCSQIGLS